MEDYRKYSNEQLSKTIQKKTQELIELRNELNRRAGTTLPKAAVDFTKYITK